MIKKAIDSMDIMNNILKKKPSHPKICDLYCDSLSNKTHYYNGKGWVVISDFEVAQEEREMLDSTYISFEENNKQDLYCEHGLDLKMLDIICFELLQEDYDRAMEVVNEFE